MSGFWLKAEDVQQLLKKGDSFAFSSFGGFPPVVPMPTGLEQPPWIFRVTRRIAISKLSTGLFNPVLEIDEEGVADPECELILVEEQDPAGFYRVVWDGKPWLAKYKLATRAGWGDDPRNRTNANEDIFPRADQMAHHLILGHELFEIDAAIKTWELYRHDRPHRQQRDDPTLQHHTA